MKRLLSMLLALAISCSYLSLAALAASSFVEAAGGPSAGAVSDALVAAGIAGIVVPCIWAVVWSNVQGRKARCGQEGAREDSRTAEDRRLDRLSGRVLLAILGIYLLVMLVVVPLAAG